MADPVRTEAWDRDILGIGGEWGAHSRWAGKSHPDPFSLLSPFGDTSGYFAPSTAPFMIKLRLDDLDGMIASLDAKDIETGGRQPEDYGKFAWILDCDGIKIGLWQQMGPAPDG